MRSTEAPVRSRACSSSRRAWRSSASLLGTGSGDKGHQRKAVGPLADQRVDVAKHGHTLYGRSAMSASIIRSLCGVTVLVPEFVRLRGPPKRQQPADLQGFRGVARPGLEPGTPRFSAACPPRANVFDL